MKRVWGNGMYGLTLFCAAVMGGCTTTQHITYDQDRLINDLKARQIYGLKLIAAYQRGDTKDIHRLKKILNELEGWE